jgi:hypothetical protein
LKDKDDRSDSSQLCVVRFASAVPKALPPCTSLYPIPIPVRVLRIPIPASVRCTRTNPPGSRGIKLLDKLSKYPDTGLTLTPAEVGYFTEQEEKLKGVDAKRMWRDVEGGKKVDHPVRVVA